MRHFRLTAPAVAEVETILEYYSHRSPKYSRSLRGELRERFRFVARHPRVGEPVDHLAPGLRKTSVRDLVIYFRDEGGVTVIHHLVHGARDIDAAFFDVSDT